MDSYPIAFIVRNSLLAVMEGFHGDVLVSDGVRLHDVFLERGDRDHFTFPWVNLCIDIFSGSSFGFAPLL